MFFQIPESNQDMVNAAVNALGTALGAAVMALLRTNKADDAKTQNTAKAFYAITEASTGPSGTTDAPVNQTQPERSLHPSYKPHQAMSATTEHSHRTMLLDWKPVVSETR